MTRSPFHLQVGRAAGAMPAEGHAPGSARSSAARIRWVLLSCLAVAACERSTAAPPPPLPAKLAFTSQPVSAMAGDAINPDVQVTIEDSLGRTVITPTNLVTLAIGASQGGGTLTGTLSAAAISGVATFSNLHIDKPGSAYTLIATVPGLAEATSAPFDITPAAAQLVFAVQPRDAAAGASIAPAVQVAATDSAGDRATAFAGYVTVTIGTNPGGITLSGTTTARAVNGVATFDNLSIQREGTGYTLTAASGALKGATSAPFTIVNAACPGCWDS